LVLIGERELEAYIETVKLHIAVRPLVAGSTTVQIPHLLGKLLCLVVALDALLHGGTTDGEHDLLAAVLAGLDGLGEVGAGGEIGALEHVAAESVHVRGREAVGALELVHEGEHDDIYVLVLADLHEVVLRRALALANVDNLEAVSLG
jgi:hypothetical protein